MALQWLTLIATIWLQSINGSNSNFPAYSSELKKLLSISQLQLNNLAFASDAGKLLGWISGLAAAHLPLWLVLIIGSFLGLVGYGVQFLFLANHLFSLSYCHVFLLTVLSGNSICWINTVCYTLAIKNFPYDRHFAIGLSTSYVGLSAKIYTDIVDVVSATSPTERAKAFLFLNAVLPLLVCIVSMPLARNITDARKSRKLAGGFFTLFMITTVTGFFAVISSFTSLGSRVLPLVGMVVLLLSPLVIPLAEKVGEKLQKRCLIRVCDEGFGSSSDLSRVESEETKDQEFCGLGGEEIGAMLMVRRVEFWLYFFVYLFGATLGLVYLNNLGQIAESRGCLRTSSLVSVASAFSFFGRLLPCLLDYFFSRKHGVSRAAAMGAMIAPMCGAFFLLVVSRRELALYMSTAVVGVCTGAITSISISATTELFGAKNFGVNHNILVSNIPMGSFLFGDLAALLYKRGGGENCMGEKCYQTTLIIWGSLCVLGTLLAFILHSRTKIFYT